MTSVHQFAYNEDSGAYEFGYESEPRLPITHAPDDTNWHRWAMAHDGGTYRMYFFKGSTRDTIYQFAWDGDSYRFGYQSEPELTLANVPADADLGSFSMVSTGGSNYHLYLRRLGAPHCLYQFQWVPGSNQYRYGGAEGIPQLQIAGFPPDTDWSRWATLHDGADLRLYAFQLGSNSGLYQGAWNGEVFLFGYNSEEVMPVSGIPQDTFRGSFSMLHDRSDYRLYMLAL